MKSVSFYSYIEQHLDYLIPINMSEIVQAPSEVPFSGELIQFVVVREIILGIVAMNGMFVLVPVEYLNDQ